MRTVVIGLGNASCGDDGAGAAVIALLPPHVTAAAARDGLDMLAQWEGFDAAIVIDAMVSDREPGTVEVFASDALPAEARFLNTHSVGLPEALGIARTLGQCPRVVIVVGVEGRVFGPCEPMSAEVVAALPRAAEEVLRLLA